MRKLNKSQCPEILAQNGDRWLDEYKGNPSNPRLRNRYRDKSIKKQIFEEAFDKCIYCESKLGHSSPGDVDHIKPVSKLPDLIFKWENMALSCTECNRRKGGYVDEQYPFLNPFLDDVENKILHEGPVVLWKEGDRSAEITIKKLELHGKNRDKLIMRKIDKISELSDKIERLNCESVEVLREMIRLELTEMADLRSEYSGMIKSLLLRMGLLQSVQP